MNATFKRGMSFSLATVLLFLLLFSALPPLSLSAAEINGFANNTVVRFKNVASGKYLNLSRANDANGANINVFTNDGTPEETWRLRYNASEEAYYIGSMVSQNGNGRVIDAACTDDGPQMYDNVQLHTVSGADVPLWKITYYGGGRYYITVNDAAGLALTANAGNGTPGGKGHADAGNVYIFPMPHYDEFGFLHGSLGNTPIPDKQLWMIEEVNPTRTIADGIYTIKNMDSQKLMDATSAGKVVLWRSHGGNNQKWKVTYHSDGFYTIVPVRYQNKRLKIKNAPDETGSLLEIKSMPANSSEDDYAKWKIIPNAVGGGYRITGKAGYYAHSATVLYGKTDNNSEIGQVQYVDADCQRWIFTRAEKEAVIVVPGIMGSELEAGANNTAYSKGTALWSGDLASDLENGTLSLLDVMRRVCNLHCNPDGTSEDHVVVRQNNYGTADTYKALITALQRNFGSQYDVRFFAYDWRLSNAISAESLELFINNTGYTSVTLIGHSMGGLVASAYLARGEAQRKLIKRNILLGAPLLGSVAAPLFWGTEDIASMIPDNVSLKDVAEPLLSAVATVSDLIDAFMGNFQSLYELFPTEKYFDSNFGGHPYLTTEIVGNSPLEVTTYALTRARFNSYLPHFNQTLANNAEAFHRTLFTNGNHITSTVDTRYVIGTNKDTVHKLLYNVTLYNQWSAKATTKNGDGTVETFSASLGGKYSAKTYSYDQSHINLATQSIVVNDVVRLISGQSPINCS